MCSRKYRRRSAIEAPGISRTPPTITRVGMPSVCESTAWNTRRARISAAHSRERLLGRNAHDRFLLGRQRLSRGTTRAAVAADDVHRELDRLDELGFGVPPEQRVQ